VRDNDWIAWRAREQSRIARQARLDARLARLHQQVTSHAERVDQAEADVEAFGDEMRRRLRAIADRPWPT